ncbi:chaperone CbpA [Streptococcus pasteurianus]|uniref:chaperone CbpA n=1 Tax=Streptococcus pasteurianus TaxID=197614 RepID=UPI0022E27994|nr:chaperone CbpA [Streptococcus pasteurianus]
MNTLYETMKNVGFATVSLGQLLLLTVLVANLSDFLSGFLLVMSIMLNVLSITFFKIKFLGNIGRKLWF